MPRVMLLVTTTSYRTDAFLAAARAVGATVVIGSDRCHQLAEVYSDDAYARLAGDGVESTVALDYRDPETAGAQIEAAARGLPLDAVVPTDDVTAVIAAIAARRLGLDGNDPEAVYAARNKARMRALLHAARVPCPRHRSFSIDPADPIGAGAADAVDADLLRETLLHERARAVAEDPGYPCVVKPVMLSASRGVIRADDPASFVAAFRRCAAIVRGRAEFADGRDPAARAVLVEEFIPGREVALEGLLSMRDGLRVLALYDKPDPLDGPFFEETIYVTPSRLPEVVQALIARITQRAARALGLIEGPIHAELRLSPTGPVVIEVAARSIGGLCARTLRYTLSATREDSPLVTVDPPSVTGDSSSVATADAAPADHALEELVLRQALRLDTARLLGSSGAAGVMMLPVPGAGVLQAVDGVEAARRVPLVEDVVITARVGEKLVPLPEGSSYPGFVFARGDSPAAVEAALRAAHRELRYTIAPSL